MKDILQVPKARVGGEYERGHSYSRKEGSGISPEEILYFRTSVKTILMHFGTIFALEALLIL